MVRWCYSMLFSKAAGIDQIPHINPSHFRKINWLPVNDRVEYCIVDTVFKYWNEMVPGYIHEMFTDLLTLTVSPCVTRFHCLSHGLTVGSSFLTVLQILSEFSLKLTIS